MKLQKWWCVCEMVKIDCLPSVSTYILISSGILEQDGEPVGLCPQKETFTILMNESCAECQYLEAAQQCNPRCPV